ncbi:hypothetical protein [Flavobacterium humi]|uniref:DUF2231 domain-containing protein n=1 Tax=Flavobacterium humi TaxID=2562683 RepID=A0A4Z0LCU9_9FLAO|nr:hypothetical protein [Flavobacterium humi]TGD59701.1 hypothetical protein E4635_01840 [Flavobacterium humi]
MNDAHLHMVVNHFPIIGLFFGFGILLYGIIRKNTPLINTAYTIFIICMIMGKISMFTGEKAEDIVENLGISHDLIHEHEELAEGFMKVLYALGIVSIFGLYLNGKRHSKANFMAYLAVVLSLVSVVLSKSVGTSGGEIRHTEIRKNPVNANHSAESESVEKK